MILDSKKWKKMEELFNRGKIKISPGFLVLVNTEFSSKKMEFPLEWKRISQSNFQGNLMKQILKTMFFLGIQLCKLKN